MTATFSVHFPQFLKFSMNSSMCERFSFAIHLKPGCSSCSSALAASSSPCAWTLSFLVTKTPGCPFSLTRWTKLRCGCFCWRRCDGWVELCRSKMCCNTEQSSRSVLGCAHMWRYDAIKFVCSDRHGQRCMVHTFTLMAEGPRVMR